MLAFISQQIVRYLNYVAIGKIPVDFLWYLIGFEIPYLFALLLPLALYLGILFAYGRLYSDQEMAMIYMGGFHYNQLIRLTIKIATIVAFFVLLLMLWLNPLISAKRQQMMNSDEATVHLIHTLMPGRFQASPDGKYVMYVEKLSRDHQRAENIFLATQTKKTNNQINENKWVLFISQEGYQTRDLFSKDQFFVMLNGYRYEGIPGQNDYTITQFKKYSIRIPQVDPRSNHAEVEAQPSLMLWQDYNSPKHAAELQWRFSIGITAFLLALLAVPLSSVRPKQGRYFIFLPAILIYIFYINLLILARRWVEQGSLSIGIGLWWVHLLLLGMILLILSAKFKWTRK